MSTSINNAFIKRSLNMPKGVGYGASSMGKVKKASIVVAMGTSLRRAKLPAGVRSEL